MAIALVGSCCITGTCLSYIECCLLDLVLPHGRVPTGGAPVATVREGTAVRRAVYRRYVIESQVVGGGRCGRRDAGGGGGGAGGAGSGQGSGIVDRHGSRYPRRRTHRGIGSHAPRRVGRHPRLLWIPRSLARSRIIGTGGTGGGRVSRPSPHADVARHDGPGRDDAHTSGPLSPGRR